MELFTVSSLVALITLVTLEIVLGIDNVIFIAVLLVIEGWNPEVVEDIHLKNYAYFAMVFAFLVEIVNMRLRRSEHPVDLHNRPHTPTDESAHPGPGQV